jgi:1,6-anhydro-N-acetylmuramate kinase
VSAGGFSASASGTGWETLSFIDILLFLVSLAAIAIVAAKATGNLPTEAPAPVVLLGLGALAVLLVIYRLIDIPAGDVPDGVDLSRKLGIFIALIGAAGVAYGGWRTNEESPGRVAPTTPPPAA